MVTSKCFLDVVKLTNKLNPMATYAEKDYDSNNYNSQRPRYPPSLYKALFDYHQGDRDLALDVGSGPGVASFPLLQYVDKVIATDASPVMIQPGIESISDKHKGRIEFKVSPGEDLRDVVPKSSSVDVLICAEALHWIKHEPFFQEAARVLKPGGTLAFWGYIEPRFVDFPEADKIYEKYVFEDPQYMGPCWIQPGKDFLRYFFDDVHPPESEFKDIEKWDYYPEKKQKRTAYFLGDDKYTMQKFRGYLGSFSAVHTWRKRNPNATVDIVDLMISEMKETCAWTDDTEINTEWGTTYIFARKR